ncbi:hypothetical protein CDAR_488571 [Caerostris darwini]|uniref:Uncharacterized protein n=1 Tax=Caerostris darwini TaxID=1538125 RepID=A0AAV4WKW1_9ARAC|nr:hypothetical protein CDAR_488571 [Caerostris darwini]
MLSVSLNSVQNRHRAGAVPSMGSPCAPRYQQTAIPPPMALLMLQAEDGSLTESNPVHCGTAMISALMTSSAGYKKHLLQPLSRHLLSTILLLLLLETRLRGLGHGAADQPLLLQHCLDPLQVRFTNFFF